MTMTKTQELLTFVQQKAPTTTEDQVFQYFLWGEAESLLRDMTTKDMAEALRTNSLSFNEQDLENWLKELGDGFEDVANDCLQSFVESPDQFTGGNEG